MINKYLGKDTDMTERESEIFEWIKENPLISQQEIADRAGITRSSVAVHISNLMKKLLHSNLMSAGAESFCLTKQKS